MDLGAFSISLAIKDLATSRSFYEKLGFGVIGGAAAQDWLILRNGVGTVGCSRACSGPASLSLVDPDGNPVLIDQHVPRPSA